MLKKLLLTCAIAGSAVLSYGQGTALFQTGISSGTPATSANSVARVFDVDGTTPLAGAAYYAQIYVSDTLNPTFHAVGTPVNFRPSAAAGYVQTSGTSSGANGSVPVVKTVTLTSQSSGAVTLQIRAWQSTYATYEAASLASAPVGSSISFSWAPAYGVVAPTDFTVANAQTGTNPGYTGIPSFQLVGTVVPEPSTIALGVIGAAALLFRRRK